MVLSPNPVSSKPVSLRGLPRGNLCHGGSRGILRSRFSSSFRHGNSVNRSNGTDLSIRREDILIPCEGDSLPHIPDNED